MDGAHIRRLEQHVIRCEGRRVPIWLNSVQTLDYVEPNAKVALSGQIGVQIHEGPPSQAIYRNIEIRELP